MKKKILNLGLCAVLIWGAFVAWNWAIPFSQMLGCSHTWFDLLAGVLFMASVAVSCAASGEPETEKKEG
jgi:hypothetical protein